MKKTILSVMAACLLLGACEQNDIPFYSGKTSIYFYTTQDVLTVQQLQDTSVYTFAYTPDKTDSIVWLTLRIKGDTVNADRPISLKLIDTAASKARPGIDFVPLGDKLVLPRGATRVNIPLRLIKTPEMQARTMSITYEIQPNEAFTLDHPTIFNASTQKTVSSYRHTVTVNDVLSRPKYWYDGYLGTYSRKKWLLMCDILEVPPNALETAIPIGNLRYYGTFTKRYLDEQAAAGNTILEEDGAIMKMGDGL
ncbi:DUF4843 domain-containing protein [Chitinophaga lutea]